LICSWFADNLFTIHSILFSCRVPKIGHVKFNKSYLFNSILNIYLHIYALKPGRLLLFSSAKKVSKTRPYRTVRSGGNAAAAEKIAKKQAIPLKENNSLSSVELKQIFFLNVSWLAFFNVFFQRRKPQEWTLPLTTPHL